MNSQSLDGLTQKYTQRILSRLKTRLTHTGKKRTFGFEYEFLPERPLTPQSLQAIQDFLKRKGFQTQKLGLMSDCGLYITFEPGGQIEYCSPPLEPSQTTLFQRLLTLIKTTNAEIYDELAIAYRGTGYIKGRETAPLCLLNDRYDHLHNRLSTCDTRGLEMMKATASIHLHTGLVTMDEILPVYKTLCTFARQSQFAMGKDRRAIWAHTDHTRCGLPPHDFYPSMDSEQLLSDIVRFALTADDLYANIPFYQKESISDSLFWDHLTTIFTDVRLNLKGPTFELRTLDSMPIENFPLYWETFTHSFNPLN